MKGQIQISWAIAMAAVSFIAAPLVGYYSSQIATGNRIGEVDKNLGVTINRVDTLEKQFEKIDQKLDALLLKQGISLDKIQTKK